MEFTCSPTVCVGFLHSRRHVSWSLISDEDLDLTPGCSSLRLMSGRVECGEQISPLTVYLTISDCMIITSLR